jgi:hypothetical protein
MLTRAGGRGHGSMSLRSTRDAMKYVMVVHRGSLRNQSRRGKRQQQYR